MPKPVQAPAATPAPVEAKKPSAPKKAADVALATEIAEREVLYPEYASAICVGDSALTADKAGELLGWQVVGAEDPHKTDYLFIDEEGNKIRCTNNSRNRPFREGWARSLAQDILNRYFAPKGPNGENVIIGRTGLVISAQHRLIGLKLACQIWAAKKDLWAENWPSEPVIETFVAFGIDESIETIRTIDNTCPRHPSDALFSDDSLLGKYRGRERAVLAKMVDFAVKRLWVRTGANDKALNPKHQKQTNSESMEFIKRHLHLIEAVKHIHEENAEGAVKNYIPPGTAATLMYLMAAGKSDGDAYRLADLPGESYMNLELWDKASEFWVLLASGSDTFRPVRNALAALVNPDTGAVPTLDEKITVICKAWHQFVKGEGFDEAAMAPEYTPIDPDDGSRELIDTVDFGGIDVGPTAEEDDDPDTITDADDEEEKRKQRIAEQKAKILANREAKKAAKGAVEGLTEAGKAAVANGTAAPAANGAPAAAATAAPATPAAPAAPKPGKGGKAPAPAKTPAKAPTPAPAAPKPSAPGKGKPIARKP